MSICNWQYDKRVFTVWSFLNSKSQKILDIQFFTNLIVLSENDLSLIFSENNLSSVNCFKTKQLRTFREKSEIQVIDRILYIVNIILCSFWRCNAFLIRYLIFRAQWLTTVGSPGSEIHHCEFINWENVTKQQYRNFAIRF